MLMTEAVINFQEMANPDQKVCRCKACMTTFGIELPDGSALDSGLVMVTVLKGNCRKCGYPVSWYSTDRYIERITKARR